MLTRKPPRVFDIPGTDLKSSYAWNPSMGRKVILRVSKSSKSTFNFCEQQYFIKYPYGVKEPENDNMRRGTNVHDAVEDFYAYLAENVDLDALQKKDYNTILDTFKSLIPTHSKEKEWGGVVKPSLPFTLDEEKHLEAFLTREATRFAGVGTSVKEFLPVINERAFDAIIEVDVFGVPVLVHLTGIIDRAFAELDDEGKPKNIHLHELKTGMWVSDSDYKTDSMREEMAFYAILMKKSKDPDFGGMDAAYWGWDHTGGWTDREGKKKGVKISEDTFRFFEPVQIKSIKKVMDDLRKMVMAHMAMGGATQSDPFEMQPVGAEFRICEPWCAVKPYCPKYGAPLKGDD